MKESRVARYDEWLKGRESTWELYQEYLRWQMGYPPEVKVAKP